MAGQPVLPHPQQGRTTCNITLLRPLQQRLTGEKAEGRHIPCILEPHGDEKVFRRNWARLIQKIYETDPLVCPKCKGAMRVISSIEDPSVIQAILDRLARQVQAAAENP